MHATESNFSNFVIEYLGELETEFENTLVSLSGAQMGSNYGKNLRSKISWHTPFKYVSTRNVNTVLRFLKLFSK